jgi:hypothetical protein
MPIKDYNDDAAMAKLGRHKAKWSAIGNARETIRDCTVRIVKCDDVEMLKMDLASITAAVNEIIEALELE